jgi:hypothetical protein
MWKQIKAHPVVTGLVSLFVVVGAVVTFFAGLATIWNAYSHDTVAPLHLDGDLDLPRCDSS